MRSSRSGTKEPPFSRHNGKPLITPSRVPRVISEQTLADSIFVWEPSDRYDQADFLRFEEEVVDTLRKVIENDLGPPVADNPTLVRQRAQVSMQVLWWLNGALTTAEQYLAYARYDALRIENANGLAAPEMRICRDAYTAREKRLVDYLQRVRETLQLAINFAQSDLKWLGNELTMLGSGMDDPTPDEG